MTDRELLRIVRNAIELGGVSLYRAAEAIDARLAQPEPEELAQLEQAMIEAWKPVSQLVEPEPVAWVDPIWMQRPDLVMSNQIGIEKLFARTQFKGYVPLYTAPPQREFIGLTDEERLALWNGIECDLECLKPAQYARAIEAKLKEKNS